MDGYHRERLVGERIIKEGHARPCYMEESHKTHDRPHIKVGKDEEKKKTMVAPLSGTPNRNFGNILAGNSESPEVNNLAVFFTSSNSTM